MTSQRSNPCLRTIPYLVVAVVTSTLGLASDAGASYRRPGTTTQIDLRGGQQAPGEADNYDNYSSAVSANSRFVAFGSPYRLSDGDDNDGSDVYVRDLKTGRIELISIGQRGEPAQGSLAAPPGPTAETTDGQSLSWDPSISKDGRFVAFSSAAINLVPADGNLATDVFVHDRKSGSTERISVSSNGVEGKNVPGQGPVTFLPPHSYAPSISWDGRFVSFTSLANNLVDNDENGGPDVFVHDRRKNETIRVSVDSKGNAGNYSCLPNVAVIKLCDVGTKVGVTSAIDPTGRYIAFDSHATGLTENDANETRDVFRHDRKTHKTMLVSVNSHEEQASVTVGEPLASAADNGLAGDPFGTGVGTVISRGGRFVAFMSNGNNLVPNDSTGGHELFVRDTEKGTTERVSVAADGRQPSFAQDYDSPSMTPDGRFLTWSTVGSSMPDPAATVGGSQIYLHDRRTGATEFVSLTDNGEEGYLCDQETDTSQSFANAFFSAISADGRYVTFSSCDRNLQDTKDRRFRTHIFLRDRGEDEFAGSVHRANDGPGAGPMRVAGTLDGNGLAPASAADITRAAVVERPELGDLFLTPDVARLDTASAGPAPGLVHGFALTVGDRAFEVRARWTGVGADRSVFELLACDGSRACEKVGDLHGGYGVAGDRIAMSVPLHMLKASRHVELDRAVAFVTMGARDLLDVSGMALDRLTVVR